MAELFAFGHVHYAKEFGDTFIDMPGEKCVELQGDYPIFCCLSTLPVGHVDYSCMLFRLASVICLLYKIAFSNGPRVASLDSFHLGESRTLTATLPVSRIGLGRNVPTTVYCTDAS